MINSRSRFLLYLDCSIFTLVLISQYFKPFYLIGAFYCGVGFLFLRETWKSNCNFRSRFLKFVALISIVAYYYLIKWAVEGGDAFVFFESFQKYFGWVVFYVYIYMRSSVRSCDNFSNLYFTATLKLVVIVIFTTSFVEFLYPDAGVFVEMREGFDADRVYGLASRPSSTATLLVSSAVALFIISGGGGGAVRMLGKPFPILFGVAFAMLASGVGVIALIIASLFIIFQVKSKAPNYIHLLKFLPLLSGLAAFVYGVTLVSDLSRHIELEYLEFLYELKIGAIFNHIQLDDLLIGKVNHEYFQYGSDFGIAALVANIGILGLIFFILLVAINVNRFNIAAVTVVLISYFHYPAIAVSSGSLVFALLLALVRLDESTRQIGIHKPSGKSHLVANGTA